MTETRRNRSSSAPAPTSSVGISNRESPNEEAQERQAFPPLAGQTTPPEDASGSVGEPGTPDGERQTSHKAGSRSVAQKEAGSKYADRPTPQARKVEGAFGREGSQRMGKNATGKK